MISDTHNHLPNVVRIVELLNAARVERVVHTGDITQAKTLDALAGLRAPLLGVYGNNDVEREALGAASARHGFALAESGLELALAGRRIVVVTTRASSPGAATSTSRCMATRTGSPSSASLIAWSSTRASARATSPATTRSGSWTSGISRSSS